MKKKKREFSNNYNLKMKAILKLNFDIDMIEKDIIYFFIINSNLKNENMAEQISHLSKITDKIGNLFDLYRDYALLKKNMLTNKI